MKQFVHSQGISLLPGAASVIALVVSGGFSQYKHCTSVCVCVRVWLHMHVVYVASVCAAMFASVRTQWEFVPDAWRGVSLSVFPNHVLEKAS